jgi:basic membrane protein A
MVLLTGAGGVPGAELKAALIVAGALGDRSFYDSAGAGLSRAGAEFGIPVQIFECNDDVAAYKASLATAGKTYDLVFVCGVEFTPFLADAASRYSRASFVHMDMTGSAPGVTYVDFGEHEGAFLAGVLAASVSKSGLIGVVAGEDVPVVRNFLVGYEQGAAFVGKDVRILADFVGSWNDPEKGKRLALAQHAAGADVIFQVAGGTGVGVIAAAKEKGFWVIGVDSAQELDAPDAVLTSMRKRLDNAVYDLIKAMLEGRFRRGATYSFGLRVGGVGLSRSDVARRNIPPDVQERIAALEKEIVEGRIVVNPYRP